MNIGDKWLTKGNQVARVICIDKKGLYPAITLIEDDDGTEHVQFHELDGKLFDGFEHRDDLERML